MNLVSDIARRSDGWGWFFVWALFGSSWALAAVSLLAALARGARRSRVTGQAVKPSKPS